LEEPQDFYIRSKGASPLEMESYTANDPSELLVCLQRVLHVFV